MVPCNHTIHQTLVEEVEKLNDIDQIKQITKKLIRDNLILTRKTNAALKSLDNQNNLIKYLQETIASLMARNVQQSYEFWAILVTEILRTFDNLMHYQTLVLNLAKDNNHLTQRERRNLQDMVNAVYTVPYHATKMARAKCISFLAKLKEKAPESADEEDIETENVETIGAEKRKCTKSIKYQNGKIDTLGQNRKQHYRHKAKKRAIRHYRKRAFNKLQNNKSGKRGRKNLRHSVLANTGETPQNVTEAVQPRNLSGKRRHKRKAEEINHEDSLKSYDENSSVNKLSAAKRTKSSKKLRSTFNDSISNSNNEPVKLKSFDLILTDFMKDPDANNDQYIAQYKQKLQNKESQNNCADEGDISNVDEFDVVDDADDDTDSDQRGVYDLISDNNDKNDDEEEDRNSITSNESENSRLKPDIVLSKSMEVDEEEKVEFPRTALVNGKKGPCTPPHSPALDDYIFRRGPRTPSFSPPGPKRGPCTPPGAAPTSDSGATEEDGDSSDNSSLSTIY